VFDEAQQNVDENSSEDDELESSSEEDDDFELESLEEEEEDVEDLDTDSDDDAHREHVHQESGHTELEPYESEFWTSLVGYHDLHHPQCPMDLANYAYLTFKARFHHYAAHFESNHPGCLTPWLRRLSSPPPPSFSSSSFSLSSTSLSSSSSSSTDLSDFVSSCSDHLSQDSQEEMDAVQSHDAERSKIVQRLLTVGNALEDLNINLNFEKDPRELGVSRSMQHARVSYEALLRTAEAILPSDPHFVFKEAIKRDKSLAKTLFSILGDRFIGETCLAEFVDTYCLSDRELEIQGKNNQLEYQV
jgi:hypothetical protein